MSNDLVVQLGAKLDQFTSDMNQAGDIADSAVSRIESSFSNLNPGVGLGGLAAAATGAVAGIAGLLTALQSVNAELAKIGQAAQYLNTTTDQVQKFQFAAGTVGIGSSDSLSNLQNVGKLLNDAQRNENSLTKLLDENNIQYKDQAGNLITINQLLSIGANLVKNAGTNADKTVIAQMLGLTQQWVPLLEKGADQFNKIGDAAQDAGVIISSQTIAKAQNFDDAWKASSDRLAKQFKAAVSDVAVSLDDLIDKAGKFFDDLNQANNVKAGSGQNTFNVIADQAEVASRDALGLAQNIDQVNRVIDNLRAKGADPDIIKGLLDIQKAAQAASDALAETTKQIQAENFPSTVPLPATRPAGANAPPSNPTQIPERQTVSDADAFTRAENQVIKRTADYNAQTEAVGKNTEAKVQAKAIADLQTAADRAKLTLTDDQKQKLLELAQAEGVAAQAAADRNQKLQEQNALLQFAGNQTISILDGLRTGSLTAAQAVTQLTNQLITAFEQAELLGTGPLAGLLGTASAAGSGTTGGLLGQLAKAFGGIGNNGSAAATASSNTLANNSGGAFFGPGFGVGGYTGTGGKDDPAGVVHKGEFVFDQDAVNRIGIGNLMKLQRGYSDGGPVDVPAVMSPSGRSGAQFNIYQVEDSSRAGQTQKTQNGNGGFDLTLYVDAITAKNAANPGSATSAALNQRGRVASR
jgi:hypothetical protein